MYEENSTQLNSIADKIRDARKSANLSQVELAEAVEVSDRAISAYEKGRNTPPVDRLKKIADKTGYALRWFVGEEDPMVSVQRLLTSVEEQLQEIKSTLKKLEKFEAAKS